jgi:hypothetical protein
VGAHVANPSRLSRLFVCVIDTVRRPRQSTQLHREKAARETWEIASNFWTQELRERLSKASPDQLSAPASFDDDNNALPRAVNFDATKQSPEQWVTTSRYGKAAAVRLDPIHIQEEYEVEPEAGSYLAVDDDLRRSAAMDLEQVAMAAPDVVFTGTSAGSLYGQDID